MTQSTNQSNNKVEVYLEKLEAKERKQRIKRIFMMLPLVLITGIMALWAIKPQAPSPGPELESVVMTRTYHADELTPNKVNDIFEVDNAEFVIDHPLLGLDTIRSPREYNQLIKLVSQAEKDRKDIDNLRVSDSIRIAAEGTLDVFAVEVVGNRVVDNTLIFSIANFDPEVKYMLDFGNGIRRSVDRKTTYAYPLPGNFVMQLYASSPQKGASVYTKKYEIKASAIQTDTIMGEFPAEEVEIEQKPERKQAVAMQ